MQLFMASHLTQRAGIFYFRARIPTHLIAAYGRAMVSISLGTRDPKEAKVRARKRREELDRALESLEHSGPKADAEYRGTRSGPACLNRFTPRDKETACGLKRCRVVHGGGGRCATNRPTRWATRGAPGFSF